MTALVRIIGFAGAAVLCSASVYFYIKGHDPLNAAMAVFFGLSAIFAGLQPNDK
jgi:hypothetical protein